MSLKLIIEALLMSRSEPMTLEKMQAAFDDGVQPTRKQLQAVLMELAEDCGGRAIELKCLASGYCFQTKAMYAPWITRLLAERPARYSNAFLEILSIIAYRQPVTRGDIEEIRGVVVNSVILKTLLEREWIHIIGHRDVPGKPAVYATTKAFLDYFNLTSLSELPSLDAVETVNHE